jgi:UDP-3-O-[3-hydroxymyristoyl] glucosamine N-acyltransferase
VTVRELAALVQGQVLGDAELVISAARALTDARPGDITFIENVKHSKTLHECQASAVVAPPGITVNGQTRIQVPDPLKAFVEIARRLHGRPEPPAHGVDPLASIDASAILGADCSIWPFAVIGAGTIIGARCRIHSGAVIGPNCSVGDDVVLFPNAVLYEGTVLGNRVIVHANAVLGADGFGYRFQDGQHVKVPQFGNVEIGDDVEIGACTTIDRGTFQTTRIGAGTKIDNLVQIGHNCRVGKHNLLVSQLGMAGSCSTGDHVVIAGQVGIVDHVHIGDGVQIGGQAGVTKDVAPGQRMLGSPATPERDQKRIMMTLERLPDIRRDLRRVMQHLGLQEE